MKFTQAPSFSNSRPHGLRFKPHSLAPGFVALLTTAFSLLLAMFAGASSSTQVEQLAALAVPRTAHTATVLSDGRVLITGGRDSNGKVLAAAEIFDPSAGTSSIVGALQTARADHTATLLQNGRVLILGGKNATGALSSAEVFDTSAPGAGFTVLSAEMGAARSGHTATLLNSGKVLIAGGDDAGTAEIFDPATNSFSSTLFSMAMPRTGHSATLFSDDSVLLAGGNTESMEMFNPADQSFTLDPKKMSYPRTGQPAIGLSDTKLLFFGGDTNNTIEELDLATDAFTLKGSMEAPASSATLLANGNILVLRPDVAGLYLPGAADLSTAFQPFDEASVPGSSELLRTGQTAVELTSDRRILVAGGVNANDRLMPQITLFNPARIWTDKNDYQPDETVQLYGSGWKPSENVYLYAVDSETEQWTYESTVKANATGDFAITPYFIVELRHLNQTFDVTTVGAQSKMSADVEFTDNTSKIAQLGFDPTGQPTYFTSGAAAGPMRVQLQDSNGNAQSLNNQGDSVTIQLRSTSGTGSFSTTPGGSFTSTLTETANKGDSAFPDFYYKDTGVGSAVLTAAMNSKTTGVPTMTNGTLSKTVRATTTTNLSSDQNPSNQGQSVTFTATISGAAGNALNGQNVTFKDNGTTLGGGPVTLSGSSGKATLSISSLSAGSHTITAVFNAADTGNYITSSDSLTQTVNAQSTTSVAVANATSSYGGTVSLSATLTSGGSGVSGKSITFSLNGTSKGSATTNSSGVATLANVGVSGINAGTYATGIGASFAGDASNSASSGTGSLTVNKTSQTITFGAVADKTYGDAPFAVSATATSNLSVAFSILSGPATISGNTVTITGAGTVTVRASQAGDSNYSAAANVDQSFSVGKKAAAITLTNLSQAYDGTAKSAGATTTPANLSVSFTYNGSATVPSNAGSYPVVGTISDTNYSGTASGTLVIGKNTATVSLTSLSQTYDGLAKTAGATTTPTGLSVSFTYDGSATAPINAGSYAVVATINDTNYSGSANGTLVVAKKAATITLTNLSQTYDGSAKSAGATTTPANLSVAFTYDGSPNAPTNAGSYAVVATINDTNYSGSANGTLVIAKKAATITLNNLAHTYDGTVKSAGATTTPANLSVSFTYAQSGSPATPKDAGSYAVVGTINDNNYSGSDTGTLVISKATASVQLAGLSHTYDGTAKHATATTNPANLSVSFTYNGLTTAPTNADSYAVVGTIDDNNYSGSANGTLVIGKANATVNVDGYGVGYDGNAHTATGTAKGVNNETLLGLDLSGTTHTNAGTYSDQWTFTDTTGNYNSASGSASDSIAKADGNVAVQGFTGPYDGNAHGATGTATGAKGENLGSLLDLGDKFTDVPGGTASWSFSGGTNYKATSGTAAINITKVNATINVQGYQGSYDGDAHGGAGTAVGVKGESLSTLLHLGNSFTNVPGGIASWTFDGNGNYNGDNGTVEIKLSKVNATIDVQGYSRLYDGKAHGASGTAAGVKSESLAALLHLGATFTNVPGGTANWTFDGDGNYNGTSGSVAITIDKADATITVNGYTGVYDGAAHGAAGAANGVAGENLDSLLNLGASFTNVPGGTAHWTFAGNGNYNGDAGDAQIKINQANAHITVNGYEAAYDGAAHGATGSASGVEATPADLGSLLDLGAKFTNVPGGTAHWVFAGNGNYVGASGDVPIKINQATANIAVQGYTGVYDGAAHGATGSASGVEATPVNLTSLLHLGTSYSSVPGGIAHWTFDGNNNYLAGSGDVEIKLAKADAHITVNGYTGIYDGAAHGATGSAMGVEAVPANLSGLLNFGASYTNVPGGTAHWTFAGDTNYNGISGDVAITISKADASIVVTPYHVTYDGHAHTAAGAATGVTGEDLGGLLTLSGTIHTNAGTYATDAWSFAGNGNYNSANATVSDKIDKANASITVTPYGVTYDGDAHTAGGTVTGVGGASDVLAGLDLGGTTHTNAGDYATDKWTFTDITGNYNDATATVHNTIAKAKATITVTGYHVTYDGAAHAATATATGVKSENLTGFNLSGTTHTGAGTYAADAWSFANANYVDDSGTVSDSIAKADAHISVNGYIGVYDGNAHSGSGSATGVEAMPANLSSLLTFGTGLTNVPGGSVGWTFAGNDNYNPASGSVAIVLTKANPKITVTPYSVTYDGIAHTATFTATGVKSEALLGINLSATTHKDAGTYNGDAWTFTDVTGNYNNANGTVNDKITQAALQVVVSPATTQYSDPVAYHVDYVGLVGGETESVLGGTLTFSPTAANAQFLAPGKYTITPSGLSSNNYVITYPTAVLIVNQEDARATYTGAMFASTSSLTSTTATVTLSATIQDITAVTSDPSYDAYAGDIQNAKVSFINRETGAVIASNLPVGLVNSGDTKTGTVTYNWSNVSLGDHTIGIVVSGYYTRDSSADFGVVQVSQLAPGSINGGGYLVIQNSAGLVPGGVGTKNNFGFNVQTSKTGVKGNINTIIRNGGKVYQIKGNVMSSLSTKVASVPSAITPSTATFNGKANIQDITNELAPVSVDGNATLQVTMSDAGEPGKSDSIAITVWNKSGGVWFSSNWNGTKTAEQTLGGGNLVVR